MAKEKDIDGNPSLHFRAAEREVRIVPADDQAWRLLSTAQDTTNPIPQQELGASVISSLDLSEGIPADSLPIEFESPRAIGFIRRSTWPATDWVWNFEVRCSDHSENCRGQERSLADAIVSCATACLRYESE